MADTIAREDISAKFDDLRSFSQQQLALISSKIIENIDIYKNLCDAIRDKEQEIKDIYDIERSALSLATLLETNRVKKEEFDHELSLRKSLLDEELTKSREETDQEIIQHKQLMKEQKDQDKKEQQRLKEEFEYQFQREQTLAENKKNDAIHLLEKDIVEKKTNFERACQQREQDLNKREHIIKEQESEYASMKEQVDRFPETLNAKIKSAVSDIETRLQKDHKSQMTILQKEYEGKVQVLEARIQSFEQIHTQQKAQIQDLTEQLAASYSKVQDIAVKAVDGSASVQAFQQWSRTLPDSYEMGAKNQKT